MASTALVILELVSAAISFILVRFMVKPYLWSNDSRYVGLPIGFTFLGVSYLFMGLTLYLKADPLADELKWVQLFTEVYAFAFLAMTYYFSGRELRPRRRLLWQFVFSALILAVIVTYFVIFEPVSSRFALPNYDLADRYISVFDIILATYVSVYTLRSHVSKPDAKTIYAPLGYIFLAFGEYSSIIWSLDSSFSALVGEYVIRLAGLSIFLFMSYQTFSARGPA